MTRASMACMLRSSPEARAGPRSPPMAWPRSAKKVPTTLAYISIRNSSRKPPIKMMEASTPASTSRSMGMPVIGRRVRSDILWPSVRSCGFGMNTWVMILPASP
ncbi:MAG: hypothetical protein A4E29_00495 [Methanomassiliicoccales archaeon PtaB.Bin134]|nr:MAG: hypothetical protein A4E29_00495 [Methanomassiliicoccales archaeon PtaB.Bin134]